MRRTLLAALLVAAFAFVLAPSAVTKKTPPPAPSGTFTLNPGTGIVLTNMTLSSEDQVQVGVCVMTDKSGSDCNEFFALGDNSGASPGTVVQLNDWEYTNYFVFPVRVVVGLGDYTMRAAYFSDGTYTEMDGNYQPGSHATVGFVKDTMVLSINDGSQNTFTEWKPALGAGSFNATVQTSSLLPTSSVKITSITGFSDGPTLDASSNPVCSFHTEFTYTSTKAKTVQGALAQTAIFVGRLGEPVGATSEPPALGASPFNPGTFFTSTNLAADSDYVFVAMIQASNNDMLAIGIGSTFTLDPTTYVDGCPPEGQLVSTNLTN